MIKPIVKGTYKVVPTLNPAFLEGDDEHLNPKMQYITAEPECELKQAPVKGKVFLRIYGEKTGSGHTGLCGRIRDHFALVFNPEGVVVNIHVLPDLSLYDSRHSIPDFRNEAKHLTVIVDPVLGSLEVDKSVPVGVRPADLLRMVKLIDAVGELKAGDRLSDSVRIVAVEANQLTVSVTPASQTSGPTGYSAEKLASVGAD